MSVTRDKPLALVAEDDDAIAHMIAATLGDAGFLCLRARDGEEALSLARREVPDCLVLDVMMPRLDGMEVAKKLKADVLASRIPILMLTALGGIDERVKGLDAGADDYLAKPFDLRELAAPQRQGGCPVNVAAGEGPQPGQQLLHRERFGQVVVGAGLEGLQSGFLARESAQHDHRHRARARLRAQRREQRDPVASGQHDVGEQQVRHFAADRVERLRPVADGLDAPALAEQAEDVVPRLDVGVRDNDVGTVVAGRDRTVTWSGEIAHRRTLRTRGDGRGSPRHEGCREPQVGFEPTTARLRIECSTPELLWRIR